MNYSVSYESELCYHRCAREPCKKALLKCWQDRDVFFFLNMQLLHVRKSYFFLLLSLLLSSKYIHKPSNSDLYTQRLLYNMSKRNPCGIWPRLGLFCQRLGEVWTVSLLQLMLEVWICIPKPQTVLFLSTCRLASVSLPSRLLNTARTVSIVVVPDSHPDKRRDGENDLFREGGEGTISSLPFLYYHSAAGCVYPCGIVSMPFALECTHVSLLSSLPQRMSVSEKGQKGGLCEMREKWFICLHLLPAECQQVLVIELLFFLDFSRAQRIPPMRIEVYFNIALVTELE